MSSPTITAEGQLIFRDETGEIVTVWQGATIHYAVQAALAALEYTLTLIGQDKQVTMAHYELTNAIQWPQPFDPIVFDDGKRKNRHGHTRITGRVATRNPDGTYDVVLYGMVGPGDDLLLKQVPRHCLYPQEVV